MVNYNDNKVVLFKGFTKSMAACLADDGLVYRAHRFTPVAITSGKTRLSVMRS
jgi:hypothetical protein